VIALGTPVDRKKMPERSSNADEFCREILPGVSRTFAVSIRLLPGELGAAVRTAYLICRIADTIEDAPELAADEKASLFDALLVCLDDVSRAHDFVERAMVIRADDAHGLLIRNTALVLDSYGRLAEASRRHVRHWVGEMISGMRKFVLAYPGGIRIQSLEEYREYCYYVAGTVGYLLTDLWHEHAPSIGHHRYAMLRRRARAFAEALQTVNILKDVARDAQHENSIYIPEQLLREVGSTHATILSGERVEQNRLALGALVQLAWSDLDQATAYLLEIPRRAPSIRIFCALPLLFAHATLRDLTRSPGALSQRATVKISRAEVEAITVLSTLLVYSNGLLSWLIARTRARPLRLSLGG
jgi:farnesyl-diphosphate farnesyltransferase